jgi:hypothetical protein
MKAHAIHKDTSSATLVGRVLCHDVRDAAGKIIGTKGAIVDADTARTLLDLPWREIHVLEVEPGDIHEEAAGKRLAAAVVGDGVEVKGYTGGQWSLAASRRGLLRVDTERLAAANALPGISLFTLYDRLPVEAGEVVAKAKVTPLVIADATIDTIERLGHQAGGILQVSAFTPHVIGAVTQERLDPKQRARFESSLAEKIAWFGGTLLPVRYTGSDAAAVAAELHALARDGSRLLIAAGASALDPLDPIFEALSIVGARMERHGAPAHPGSLLWVARWDDRTVIGMPTCGMFSQATTFDLVLPRLLAGEPIGNADIAELGHGGLLSRDMAYRFPPYRANAARGELE